MDFADHTSEFADAAWEIHKERGGGYFPTALVHERVIERRNRRKLPPLPMRAVALPPLPTRAVVLPPLPTRNK